MMVWLRVLIGVLGLAGGAQAEPADRVDVAQLLTERLERTVLARLRDAPDRALAQAAEMILGHGDDGAIGPEGIERAIAVDRAAARARRMLVLLAADLDNDGAITGDEVAAVAATLDADARGRLAVAMRTADRDKNGTVDMAELRGFADAGRPGSGRVERLRALLAFDLDGDTRVTLEEVSAGLRALQDRPVQRKRSAEL